MQQQRKHRSNVLINEALCSRIDIRFNMDAVGLVGGDFESKPSVHSWCSFNPHRIVKPHTLDSLTPGNGDALSSEYHDRMEALYRKNSAKHPFNRASHLTWFFGMMLGDDEADEGGSSPSSGEDEAEEKDPALDFYIAQNRARYQTSRDISYDMSEPFFHGHRTLRTDASIWLKLMTVSYFSGIPKIDEADRRFTKVRRDIQSGVCQLELYDIFREAAQHAPGEQGARTFHFESAFVDPKLMNIEMAELVQQHQATHGEHTPITEQDETRIINTAYLNTRKAVLHVTVSVHDFNIFAWQSSLFAQTDLKTSRHNASMDMHTTLELNAARLQSRKSSSAVSSLSGPYNNNNNGSMYSGGGGSGSATHVIRKSFNPIMYNSRPGIASLRAHLNRATQIYCNAFIELDPQRAPRYQPLNDNVKKLHLPYFIGEQGTTSVVNYFSSHMVATREYPNEEMRLIEHELYEPDVRAERHFVMMVRASLRRHGMSTAKFCSVIADHHNFRRDGKSVQNDAHEAHGTYVMALKVLSDVGTFAANSAHYTADFRYRRVSGDAEHDRLGLVHTQKINLDSFDSTLLNGTGNADDCEGQGNVAATILETLRVGRHSLGGQWHSELLEACRTVLDRSVIMPVGSTVTSAYVDNNNKPVDMGKEDATLPIVDSDLDKRSHCDGHCFALLIPMAVTDQLLKNGAYDAKRLAALRERWFRQYGRDAQFEAREYTVPIMVLEGTGSVEPTILPVDEIYDGPNRAIERCQVRTATAFMKQMKKDFLAALPVEVLQAQAKALKKGLPVVPLTHQQQEARNIMEMFNGEGLAFYQDKRPKNERVSRFYREVIHAVPCALYEHDVTLSQVTFCKRSETTGKLEYGVNMGELLRAGPSHARNLALVTPFSGEAQEWDEHIVPMIESIQNQMPIQAFGNYSDEDYAERIYSRYMPRPGEEEEGQQAFERLAESVSGDKNLAMVRMQSRDWKLTDPERVAKLRAYLDSRPGVVAQGWFSERHLPNCDALVDILLIVRTDVYAKTPKRM